MTGPIDALKDYGVTYPPPGPADVRRRPEPLPVSEMVVPPTADTFLVDHLARPSGLVLVAAPTGAGKSMVRTELEHRLAAAGGSLFGYYPVNGPLTVLTIDEDNGAAEEYRRDEASITALGIERAALHRLYRVSYPGLLLERDDSRDWLRERVLGLEVGVLILDPLGHMYAVKETREDLQPIVNFLRQLQRDRPGLLIFGFHHTRKLQQGTSAADRTIEDVRSSVWIEYADVVALLSPLGDRRAKWSVHKRIAPTSLILQQQDDGGWRYVADATEARVTNEDRVMTCVDAGARAVADIVAATRMSERTVWTAVKKLRAAKLLMADGALRRPAEDE